jgi:putative ABC transport system substrate-binding protein
MVAGIEGGHLNTRRKLVIALGAGALAAPFGSFAQQQGRVWRIGYLSPLSGPDAMVESFRDELRKLGYVEARNLVIEYRWAGGDNMRLQQFADELVRQKVDVIVTTTTLVAATAKHATTTIPIVMITSADPVGAGVAASLAHPGGNVTGFTTNSTEVVGKRIQLLREIVPKAKRIAVLIWKETITKQLFVEATQAAARKMNVALVIKEVSTPAELEGMCAAMRREGAQALIVQQNAFSLEHRERIAQVAARNRLPVMFESRGPGEGGLMAYGPDLIEMRRRAAQYVDLIFKGTKPADLPIQQPTTYKLSIDLKAAKATGVTIPQSLIWRADEVIE